LTIFFYWKDVQRTYVETVKEEVDLCL